jgi:hypothetical protein
VHTLCTWELFSRFNKDLITYKKKKIVYFFWGGGIESMSNWVENGDCTTELNVRWMHDCGPIKKKVQKHKRNFLPFKNTKGRKLVALILSLMALSFRSG